jgi:hypothetical protein
MRCELVSASDGRSYFLDIDAEYDNGAMIMVTLVDDSQETIADLYIEKTAEAANLYDAVFAAFEKFFILRG